MTFPVSCFFGNEASDEKKVSFVSNRSSIQIPVSAEYTRKCLCPKSLNLAERTSLKH